MARTVSITIGAAATTNQFSLPDLLGLADSQTVDVTNPAGFGLGPFGTMPFGQS